VKELKEVKEKKKKKKKERKREAGGREKERVCVIKLIWLDELQITTLMVLNVLL